MSEHRIDLSGWVCGEAQYECEVQVDDWVSQLNRPVRMQPLAWRFAFSRSSGQGPMLSELSRECTFWEWSKAHWTDSGRATMNLYGTVDDRTP